MKEMVRALDVKKMQIAEKERKESIILCLSEVAIVRLKLKAIQLYIKRGKDLGERGDNEGWRNEARGKVKVRERRHELKIGGVGSWLC
jgi:hypothetical protein